MDPRTFFDTSRWVVTAHPPGTPVRWPVPARRLPAAPKPVREPPAVDTPYLDVREAAAYCRVAVKTLYNHRRHIERMPGVRKLVFRKEALDAWLAARRKPRRRR